MESSSCESGAKKETKTGVVRRYRIEPSLMPLLRAMHRESGGVGGLVADMPNKKFWARRLREHLVVAGVVRSALHENDDTRRSIVFHDLKATAVSWMAIRGDEPLKIKQRAAHRSFATTERYLRAAEMVGEAIGEPFPQLPAAVLGAAEPGVSITVPITPGFLQCKRSLLQ